MTAAAPQNQVLVVGQQGALEMRSFSEEAAFQAGDMATQGDISFQQGGSLSGDAPLTLRGPVRMSFSFQSGGRNVDVGLEIDPTDVSMRVIDRRPSFVVAMNEHIRGQINDAMMKFSHQTTSEVE
jgi:hypothetical protein